MLHSPDAKFRTPSGGELLSPAIDLVSVARRLGRLSDVRKEVMKRNADSPAGQKKQMALQILLSIAADEYDLAADQIVEFHRSVAAEPIVDAERGPESIVIWTGSLHSQTQSVIRDLAFLVYDQARSDQGPRSERWHRQIYAITYLLEWLMQHPAAEGVSTDRPRWQPIERTSAETNGEGFPIARWSTRSGEANHMTGHDRDYLLFDTPLMGNFTVEAKTSTFDYHDIRLGYGGIWAGPKYDLKSLLNGKFHDDHPMQPIEPPLPTIRESMRVRLDVRDGQTTTSVNSRPVFTHEVSTDDPWLTIFSYWYTHGWVRNLRISGEPVIPDQVFLATHPELRGWSPYFDESVGTESATWHLADASDLGNSASSGNPSSPILIGDRDRTITGSWQESLLRYHRPFFEDGTIEYEFFYEPGQYAVHPALGRCAFLLDPNGVQRHWVTDGKHDRTGLDPANWEPLVSSQPMQPLSLNRNSWNTAGLRVTGDVVSVLLNGEVIGEQKIPATSQRQFGLFHYADQTEVRVRNIRWRGDWPRDLPPPPEQELADDSLERMLAGPELPAVFEHEFSKGVPLDQFLVTGEGWREEMENRDDGIFFRREGADGYDRYIIIPQLSLSGDFDIVAKFADFDGETGAGGHANIQLMVGIEGQQTECRIFRKFSRYTDQPEPLIQSAIFETNDGRTKHSFPQKDTETSTAGSLRLVRRGERLYYLYAVEDSSNFRLLDSTDVPIGDTAPFQLRLVLETYKPGHAEVTWKSLTVKAERMSGPALHESESIADLNAQRDKLPEKRQIDFRQDADRRYYSVFGDYAQFVFGDDGLNLTVPGSDRWMGAGVQPRIGLQGDFDITLELDVPKLEPTADGEESVVFLEVEIGGAAGPRIDAKYAISQRGVPNAELQVRTVGSLGQARYMELGSLPFKSIGQLRIARRGETAYVLCQEQARPPQLLGRLDVGRDPIPIGGLRATVHTGGAGRETVARFRTLDMAAEQLVGISP